MHRIELAIDSAIQFRKYTDKDKVNFLDKEKGLGFKTEDSGGWIGWNEFGSFKETRRYFLLYYINGATHVIYKRTLADDTIMKIREMLSRKLKGKTRDSHNPVRH
ncbi:MAG: YcxB family protein [Planctomycetota bacterium]